MVVGKGGRLSSMGVRMDEIEYRWQHAVTQQTYTGKPHVEPDDKVPEGWHEETDTHGIDGAWMPFAALGNVVHWRRLVWRRRSWLGEE